MARSRVVGGLFVVLSCILLAPASWAQQTPSGIAGVVRDESGGALPGVTVEAASPALIEKVRSVVTDGEGRYNIIDLRPGTYSVTFTLPGFSTFKRDGIILTVGFTATVNGDMKVGALEETITVTGEAPLVDTTNVRQQRVLSDEVLTALPTGQTNTVSLIALTPGMTGNATVGGSTGQYHGQQTKGTFHGKRGSHIKYDGMRIDNYAGSGDSPGYLFNIQTVEESSVETGGAGADSGAPNVGINMIPKEGGNTFRFGATGAFSNNSFQSDNLSDELAGRGLQSVPEVEKMYDAGFTVGGPISKDKVWFFAAIRRWGTKNRAANLFHNALQGTMFYQPDFSRPAHRDEKYQSHASRITWQINPKNKLNFFVDIKHDCVCETGGAGSGLGSGATNSQEGVLTWDLWPNGLIQGTWSSPITSRLLLEAGASAVFFHWPGDLPEGVTPNDVSILETTGVPGGAPGNFRYNSPGGTYPPERRVGDRFAQRFAVSYVTGSHAIKTGFTWDQGYSDQILEAAGLSVAPGIGYRFNRGVPTTLDYSAYPRHETYYQRAEMGLYAQDQWTLSRLTLNYGVRWDYYLGAIPEVHRPAGPFVPEVRFPETKNAPNLKDLNPRMGMAYDLFGDGRTALKASFGRYVAMTGNSDVSRYHPLNTSINSANRPWTDADGDYFPDCNLANFAANGECGPINNTLFGQSDPNARSFADDVRYGWGRRFYTWDFGTEVQHQLTQAISMTAGYYHNWDGGLEVTDNTQVTPADYQSYCITAPSDPRLPGGGGYQVCGLYDIVGTKFGQVRDVVTKADNFGEFKRYNDFVGVNIDTRFGSGIRLGGGVDTGRTVEDYCFAVDSPGAVGNNPFTTPHTDTTINGEKTCRNVNGLAGNTQVKFNGSYPLPYGVVLAATYQNVPGLSYIATYQATTAEAQASLGRPLSGGTRTVAVPLVRPNTLREPRRTQVDLRFTKMFEVGRARMQANFDLYNLFNRGDVLGENTTFGPAWRTPTLILNGRLIQIGGRIDF